MRYHSSCLLVNPINFSSLDELTRNSLYCMYIVYIFCVNFRSECAENEGKASEKCNEIKEGMKEVTDKIKDITETKKKHYKTYTEKNQ